MCRVEYVYKLILSKCLLVVPIPFVEKAQVEVVGSEWKGAGMQKYRWVATE